jgi:hypothetical protein
VSRASRLCIVGLVCATASPVAQAGSDDDKSKYDEVRSLFCGNEIRASEVAEACSDGLSVEECYRRLIEGHKDKGAVEERARTEELTNSRNLIEELATPLPLPVLSGALPDLLPGIKGGFLQSALNKVDDPHTLGGELNSPLNPSTSKEFDWFTVSFAGFLVPQPKINPVLESRLLDTQRTDVLRDIQGSPKPWDDAVYQVQITPTWTWVGRNIKWFDSLHSDLWRTITHPPEAVQVVPAVTPLGKAPDPSRDLAYFADYKMSDAGMKTMAACLAGHFREYEAVMQKRAVAGRISEFYRLVSNQPQLIYARKELRRSGAVGPDSRGQRLTISSGIYNNVDFLRVFGSCHDGLKGSDCPASYLSMLNAWPARLDMAVSAFYEWGNIAGFEYTIPLANPGGPIPGTPDKVVVDGGRYVRWGVSAGMTLTDPHWHSAADKEFINKSSRIDAVFEDSEFGNNSYRADYWVARLTYTYRVGSVSFPIHLVYRNRAEFKVEAIERVSAGLGIGLGW